jgi:SAM-dependent methyltransferase
MSITADQERQFYDDVYGRFLGLPDHQLAAGRDVLLRDLNNPNHPIWERRRLHLLVLERLLAQPVAGLSVLDYGCGTGDWGLMLASEGSRVTLLDLSPKAIELVRRRARATGVEERVRAVARDASDLTCFMDGEFDLVYASAALHHTLKYPGALEELVRVIRLGGRLVLAETLGNNPLLNGLRRMRARVAGEVEDAGEEIILGDAEIALLRRHFSKVEIHPLNLLAMGKRLLRGRFHHPWARASVATLEAADRLLLTAIPALKRYCGEALLLATK